MCIDEYNVHVGCSQLLLCLFYICHYEITSHLDYDFVIYCNWPEVKVNLWLKHQVHAQYYVYRGNVSVQGCLDIGSVSQMVGLASISTNFPVIRFSL